MNSTSDQATRKKCLFFVLAVVLFGQVVWGAGDPEDPRVLMKYGKAQSEISKQEVVSSSPEFKRSLLRRVSFDPDEKALSFDIEAGGLDDFEDEEASEVDDVWPLLQKRYDKGLRVRDLAERKKAQEAREASRHNLLPEEKKRPVFLKKEEEQHDKRLNANFYLKLGRDEEQVKLATITSSLLFKNFLDSVEDDLQEKKKFFDEEKNKVLIDLNSPLRYVKSKWAKDFKKGYLKKFIKLCEQEDGCVQATLRQLKQKELETLILFADFVQATKRPDANHNPRRDVLKRLSKELAGRIKSKISDEDFLKLPKKKNAFLWQIMDKFPDGVLNLMTKTVFPDERNADPVELKGHRADVSNAVSLPDGRLLTASMDCQLRMSDLDSMTSKHFAKVGRFPFHILLDQNDKLILNGGYCRTVILDPIKDKIIHVLKGHRSMVNFFDLQGEKLASASDDETIRIWNTKTGKCEMVLRGHGRPVNRVLWLSDHELVSGDDQGKMYFWDFDAKKNIVLDDHQNGISSLIRLADGRFASSSLDGTIRIWSPHKKEAEKVLSGHKARVDNLLLLPGNKIASFCRYNDLDKSIHIWSLDKQDAEKVLKGHTSKIISFLLLPDNKIASIGKKEIIIWDVDGGEPDRIIKEKDLHFSRLLYLLPDGRLATASLEGTLLLWNVLDIFKDLTFRQSVLARLLQLNSMLPKDKKVAVFSNKKLGGIFNSLKEKSKRLFLRLGWLRQ